MPFRIASALQASALQYATRGLMRDPAFSLTVLITLTLVIGANSAVFTLANALLLANLPVTHPERLVEISTLSRKGVKASLSIPAFQAIQQRASAFSSVFAWSGGGMENLEMNGVPFAGSVDDVAGDYYPTLGIRPALGRLLTREDIGLAHFTPAAVAVIGYQTWQGRYGGDPQVLGQSIRINGRPFTIVGVHPAAFTGLIRETAADATIPATASARDPQTFFDPTHTYFTVIARLKEGTGIQAAQSQMETLWPTILPAQGTVPASRIQVEPAQRGISYLRERFTRPLYVLLGIVVLLVLLACVNLANVALARAERRAGEFSIRAALGARPVRLVREALLEAVLLGAGGIIPGLALAYLGSDYIGRFMWQGYVPLALALRPDLRVVLFTSVCAIGASILCTLIPAWRSAHQPPGLALQSASARIAGRPGFIAPALVTIQIALSFAILAGALLFTGSLRAILGADPGFRKSHLVVAQLFPRSTYRGVDQAAYLRQLLQTLRSVPGVAAASVAHDRPIGIAWKQTIFPANLTATNHWISPGFFDTLRIPILRGRDFRVEDDASRPPIAIVSAHLAALLYPDEDPLGRTLQTGEPKVTREIVGVVSDAALDDPRSRDRAALYTPLFQTPENIGWSNAVVRTFGDSAAFSGALRKAIQSLGREYPLRIETVQEEYEHALRPERLLASLSACFGGLGLLLAAVGLYGLLNYSLSRRAAELAIRLALGATPAQITLRILRDVAAMLLAGLALGYALFRAGEQAVSAVVYGLTGHDPKTLLLAAALLIAVAFAASVVPAWRAIRTDPALVLRHQ